MMTPLRGVTINALPIAEQIKRALQLNATRVMDLFRSWDENGDGQVSCAEFHHAMAVLGLEVPAESIDELFAGWDADGGGTLEFYELSKILRGPVADLPTKTALPAISAKVQKTFSRFDVNHNGYLEIQELRKALEHHGLDLSTAEAGRILSVYDDKPNGKLDLSEFAQVIHDLSATASKVKLTFSRFDANDSGYLEIQELRKALEHHGLDLSTAEAGRIMSVYDGNPNGKLDLSEFTQVIHDLSASLLHPTVQRTASKGATPPPTEINRKAYQRAMAEFGMDLGAGEEGEADDDHTDNDP
jgi:calcium-binding protein CML